MQLSFKPLYLKSGFSICTKAEYQNIYTSSKESQLDMVKKLELSFDQFRELDKY